MGGNSEKAMTDFPGDKTELVGPRTARCVFSTLFLTVRRPAKKATSPSRYARNCWLVSDTRSSCAWDCDRKRKLGCRL